MASPKNPTSSTVTATEVHEPAAKTAARSLSAREEKAVRMRAGASFSKTQPLPRRGQANEEARAELAALEIELTQKLASAAPPAAAPGPKKAAPAASTRTKEKDKIVRALRRLK